MSKNRILAGLISNNTSKVKEIYTDSDNIVTSATLGVTAAAGTATYSSPDLLPASATNGDQALVTSTNRLYIYSGGGWYNIALVNNTPYWITEPDSDYTLGILTIDSDLKIIILAGDSEGLSLTYSATVDSDFNVAATITHDSDNIFIVRRRDSESGAGTTGNVTFKASDGINVATFVSTFTITEASSYTVQGSTYGWTIGGYPGPANYHNKIQRFAFAGSDNASDIGDMVATKYGINTGKSSTHGLEFGGASYPGYSPQATTSKFSFASGGNAVAGTDLSASRQYGNRTPVQGDADYAYLAGAGINGAYSNDIVRVATTIDAVEADVGDLTVNRNSAAHSSSGTYGYTAGGYNWPNTPAENDRKNVIDKFPFVSTANATDVGDITSTRNNNIGTSSSTHGYTNGGDNPSQVQQNIIEKYPFASDGNAADVGDLTYNRRNQNAASSTDKGFVNSGGISSSAYRGFEIQSYPFASDANATDLGDLDTAAASGGGTEN